MKKKVLMFVCFTLCILLVFTACSSPKSTEGNTENGEKETPPEKIIMKVSHPAGPDTERDLGAKKLKEVVEKLTDGKVEVQIYPSGQLGGQRDQVEGVQFGSIECSIVPTSYMGSTSPILTLLDTPYLLPTDPDQLTELYNSDPIKQLLNTTKEKGILTLSIWQTGYKVWTANKPLLSPKEMKGMKIRVMNSPITFKQAEVLGATGITMDFGETYAALQNGTIDGQENPIALNYDMKFHEVQSDITLTNHSGLDQLVIVNLKWFEGLDADIQNAIIEGVKQGGLVCKEQTLLKNEEYMKLIKDTGKTTIHELTEEQLKEWKEALKPVQEFARTSQGDKGAEIYDAIVAEVKKITGEN
jgi:C4-dicarboxylate-binding protein DctP